MKLERPKFHNYPPGEFPTVGDKAPYFDTVELKYDGWWGQLLLEGQRWNLFSRTGQLKKQGTLTRPVERTLIHGEYCYGTEWAKDHPEYYDQLAVYGAEMLDGRDVREVEHADVRRMVDSFLVRLREQTIVSGVFLVNRWPISAAREVWEQNTEFEGLVFKNSRDVWGSPYGRMKRDATIEYICLGFEESESDRHAGWGVASVIGGLIMKGTDTAFRACKVSGLDDKWRAEFFQHPDKYVGKVFEAEGKKVTKTGALRHPNFVRWRPDKQAADCVWGA